MDNLHRISHGDSDGKTVEDFGAFGLSVFAYARPGEAEGQPIFTIHAADGSHIGTAPNRLHAHAAMIQHGLIPLSLH